MLAVATATPRRFHTRRRDSTPRLHRTHPRQNERKRLSCLWAALLSTAAPPPPMPNGILSTMLLITLRGVKGGSTRKGRTVVRGVFKHGFVMHMEVSGLQVRPAPGPEDTRSLPDATRTLKGFAPLSLRIAMRAYFATHKESHTFHAFAADNYEPGEKSDYLHSTNYYSLYGQVIVHFQHFAELVSKDILRAKHDLLAIDAASHDARQSSSCSPAPPAVGLGGK